MMLPAAASPRQIAPHLVAGGSARGGGTIKQVAASSLVPHVSGRCATARLRCRLSSRRAPSRISGSVGGPEASAPKPEEEEEEAVPLRCAGLSVTPWGFVAILTPEFCSLAEPQNNLEAAMMADCKAVVLQLTSGTDVERAESIEALTMLQLVQGIDVGVRLPYDALLQACPGVAEGSILEQVTLDSLTPIVGDGPMPDGSMFAAKLHVKGENYPTSDPFTSLGLALRYKTPILMQRSAFGDVALETDKVKAAYPEALSVEESRQMSHSITHNISVAWRVNATPIGDSDMIKLKEQLSERGRADK